MPLGQSVIFWRSRCTACGHEIRFFDNVPLLSWVALGGRCRDCRTPISARYPLVEALTAAVFALIVASFGPTVTTLFRLGFAAAMVAVVFIDLDHQIIPDRITLPGLALGLAASFFGPPGPWGAVLGALVGGGTLYAVGWGYERLRRIEGMGGGDVKLGLMLGAFTGWQGALFTLMAASAAGAVVGLSMVAARRANGRTALPFGTFLAPAAILALLAAPAFFSWYGALLRR
ncbi:MAG: prepilin peptidase [Candidatus Eisenbacteria bacterium]|nr:prepilin peptidase [Candidatus Eisenbacteria bacterium]